MRNSIQRITFPARLVCPRCRIPGEDGLLVVSHLDPVEHEGDRCGRCGTLYARIEDIRCVPPDLEHFRKSQASALDPGWICRDAEAAATACRRASELDLSADEFGEILFQCQHALAHFPQAGAPLYPDLECNIALIRTLRGWLEQHEAPGDSPAQCALEVGCGPGAFLRAVSPLFRAGALGMDVRIGVLRLARRLADSGEAFIPFCTEGRRFEPIRISAPPDSGVGPGQLHFLQGDIYAPPLDADAFPAVIALSLLDTVPDPLFALGQIDALLAPRGLLLIGTPYSWDPRTTAPGEWWSQPAATGGEALRDALAGRNRVIPHLRYEVLAEADRIAWAVPGHGRLVYRFFLDVVLARKRG